MIWEFCYFEYVVMDSQLVNNLPFIFVGIYGVSVAFLLWNMLFDMYICAKSLSASKGQN